MPHLRYIGNVYLPANCFCYPKYLLLPTTKGSIVATQAGTINDNSKRACMRNPARISRLNYLGI